MTGRLDYVFTEREYGFAGVSSNRCGKWGQRVLLGRRACVIGLREAGAAEIIPETPPEAAVPKNEIYISVDVEADGPIPGPYSMLSFGMAACGTFDGHVFVPDDPAESTFYAELKPISEAYVPEALAVSGLDRDHLAAEGLDPVEAMNGAADWVTEVAMAANASPVLVAYPLGFDWMFLYWYWMRFADAGSPFGHSRHLDLKSLYAAKAGAMVTRSTKRQMPAEVLSDRPHTHNALDDAIEQAELFHNLIRWAGPPH